MGVYYILLLGQVKKKPCFSETFLRIGVVGHFLFIIFGNQRKQRKLCTHLYCSYGARLIQVYSDYTLFHEKISTLFFNKISLPEPRNKRKSVLEITKMYYFKI